jgi:CheY-like chemotaxis protein
MDRRLPGMDGIETTRRIRELPGGKDVKIIAVTASAFMEQRQEMLVAGMDDFVRKPYRFNEIYQALERQLGVRYTYAETLDSKEPIAPVVLTPAMLVILPPELRNELHNALESLDSECIADVLRKVEAFDAMLYKTLAHLVDNFDYPAILYTLQQDANQSI